MFNRKLAVAALLVLCAVSASASNFRGADQVYLPAAANIIGGGGSVHFYSDVYIANLSSDEVDVSVIFQPQQSPNPDIGVEFKKLVTLAACTGVGCQGERREIKDIIGTLQARPEWNAASPAITVPFGMMIFNACLKDADCSEATQDEFGDSPNFRDISIQSRIYSTANTPGANLTTGQLFSGIPWYHYVSTLSSPEGLDKVFITGLTHNGTPGTAGTFRANVGVVNSSQYSQTDIVIKLYQGSLQAADLKATATATLGPLDGAQKELPAWFSGFVFGANYFVTVEQTNVVAINAPDGCTQGCPGFLAYGSVLDNGSGDATTQESQYLVPLSDAAQFVIYPGAGNKSLLRRGARH